MLNLKLLLLLQIMHQAADQGAIGYLSCCHSNGLRASTYQSSLRTPMLDCIFETGNFLFVGVLLESNTQIIKHGCQTRFFNRRPHVESIMLEHSTDAHMHADWTGASRQP